MRFHAALGLLPFLFACNGDPKTDATLDSVTDSARDSANDSAIDTDPPDTGTFVDQDGDSHGAGVDCNDNDPDIYPGAEETCDGVDNDCDGSVDEGVPADAATWYADNDGDGYGTTDDAVEGCDAPRGYVSSDGDCDDTDPALHPGATEYDCTDPVDYNCDGSVGFEDVDGDGFAACEDCDDSDLDVNEDAVEICDLVDNDCNGDIDDDATDAPTWHLDADDDGYGGTRFTEDACTQPSGYVASADDCDDLDAASYPGAAEVCDESDNDCDGTIDEGVQVTWYADSDGDGYGDATTTSDACQSPPGYSSNGDDCDDNNPSAHPGSFEVCDSADNDCDGDVDESDAINASNWYADSDGDGYGDPSSSATSCDMPSGYTANSQDCDDTTATVSPSANEICDTVDNDCDGTIDEGDSTDAVTWYADVDLDGYGDAASTTEACSAPTGYVSDSSDCNDDPNAGGAGQYPGLAETWYDGVDQDCDGNDNDQDGDGTVLADDCDDTDNASTVVATDADCDTVLTVDDCNDNDATSTTVATDADCDGVLTADDCDDTNASATLPGSDASCPESSCLQILNDGYSTGDGDYWIQPGSTAIQVTCDMSTDGGGYTYYPVSGGTSTSRYTDNNTCKTLGMDIVYPRTKAHWDSMIARFSTSYFPFIPGVYKTGGGGNYTGCVMNSSGCGGWRVGDGGQWWLRSSTYSEPNGDYSANCWLGTRDVSNTSSITYNDGHCSYGGSSYICSTNDKP